MLKPVWAALALIVVLMSSALCWGQPAYDLILAGGHVIDPKNGIDGVMDVAVREGRVAAVGEGLDASRAEKTIDVSGLYVTPALIDIHTHLFHTTGIPGAWAGDNSVAPDGFSFRTGVATMADAGSSGWRNFEAFRQSVIDRARTRVFAFINIAGFGMITDAVEQDDFDPAEVARLARKHKDVVVGVKTAHYQKPDWISVDSAVEAGRKAGIPVMVDFGYFLPERPYWRLVTEHLRPGDISTHMFRGPVPYVDDDGKLLAYLKEARTRGVKFGVGHGGGSFVFRNAAPAIAQRFYPDAISTDLHTGSMNGAMMDMPTTMSKMLALGMPLEQVIRASTWRPARIIQREQFGHLSAGAVADIAVWRLMKGDFGFADPYGRRVEGTERLLCEMTLKDGRVVWDWNARNAGDDKNLGPAYGIREGTDEIIRPK
jgi:dihydroorotase